MACATVVVTIGTLPDRQAHVKAYMARCFFRDCGFDCVHAFLRHEPTRRATRDTGPRL
eukprot:COSAG01_NODE_6822_length_3483_cov_7.965426_1_plen_57_part_10